MGCSSLFPSAPDAPARVRILNDVLGTDQFVETPATRGECIEGLLWAIRAGRSDRLVGTCVHVTHELLTIHFYPLGDPNQVRALMEAYRDTLSGRAAP